MKNEMSREMVSITDDIAKSIMHRAIFSSRQCAAPVPGIYPPQPQARQGDTSITVFVREGVPIMLNEVIFKVKKLTDGEGNAMIMVSASSAEKLQITGDAVLWDGNDWSSLLVATNAYSEVSIYKVKIYSDKDEMVEDADPNDVKLCITMLAQPL